MEEKLQYPIDFQPGDKIRIRSGPLTGMRGIICTEAEGLLEIQLDENENSIVSVPVEGITNYSLAARRAWQVMPKRAGRPQLLTPRKKMVSMRLDVDVWTRLDKAAELGLIPNKEQIVNIWLRERLDALFGDESHDLQAQE